jgi:uncharacterized membrane protein
MWKAIRLLSILGIILATYLFVSYLTRPAFQPCYLNSVINCDAVIKGPISVTLGIPTALYGLAGYIAIFILTFFKKTKLVIAVATFGMLFCLRLTFIEIFILKVYCPVCLTCQLDMLATFILSLLLLKKKPAK